MQKYLFSTILFIAFSSNASADFEFANIKKFPRFEHFQTMDQFENYITEYENRCMNAVKGKEQAQCFIRAKVWKKELMTYFKKLGHQLKYKEQVALRESQQAWQQSREQAITFNHMLAQKHAYPYLTEMQKQAEIDANMFRTRALILKDWCEQKKLK